MEKIYEVKLKRTGDEITRTMCCGKSEKDALRNFITVKETIEHLLRGGLLKTEYFEGEGWFKETYYHDGVSGHAENGDKGIIIKANY